MDNGIDYPWIGEMFTCTILRSDYSCIVDSLIVDSTIHETNVFHDRCKLHTI